MEKIILNFVDDIITSGKPIMQLSKEDIAYLSEETDIQMLVCTTDKTDNNRMSEIISSLKQQCNTAISSFQRYLLVIEYNPEYLLLAKDIEILNIEFLQRELLEKEIKWGLTSNPAIKSLKVSLILSK